MLLPLKVLAMVSLIASGDIGHQFVHGAVALLAEVWPAPIALGLIGLVNMLLLRRRAQRTMKWSVAGGIIRSSHIQKGKSGSSVGHGNTRTTTYKGEIVYTYTVDGSQFEGSRVQFGATRRAFHKYEIEQFIESYPEGKAVDVHYDPENPGKSVLEVGLSPTMKKGMLFIAAMLALGGLGWIASSVQ
jgi:Protein of unknown function (DUF3592)